MTCQGYVLEIAPEETQIEKLYRQSGLSRVVFNHVLARVKVIIGQRAAERTYGIPDDQLTPAMAWNKESLETYWKATRNELYPWFIESKMSSRVPKMACESLAKALKNWADSKSGKRKGKKVGFPKFKRRKDGASFKTDSETTHLNTKDVLYIPFIGTVTSKEDASWLYDKLSVSAPVKKSNAKVRIGPKQLVTNKITSAKVFVRAGRWFVSFSIDIDRDELNESRRAPAGSPMCGIDVGLKHFATISNSDGTRKKIDNPRHLQAALRKLRRANKKLSRMIEGSNNWHQQCEEVAKIYLDVSNKRKDFLHKLTTELARTKSVIVVEDLNIAGMVQNKKLARAILDAAWGEFFRQLQYKCEWYGCKIVPAGRWFASSKLCSQCGHKNEELTLKDRSWKCDGCGIVHDRDENASDNLLTLAA